jgi:alkylation response protein AidB-like acyl-CoA dehydrogenase
MGAAGAFNTTFMGQTGIGILPLVYYGTTAQNEKYLTRIMTGEWLAAYCLTEPGSGSDALGAKTSAVLSADGKSYCLNGTKQFITNAAFADIFTVFAKVDGIHFTAFLVERSSPGLTVGPEEKKLGIKGSSTCQVILDNVRVPIENVLGEIGKGHKIAFNVLNIGRLKVGAAAIGAAKHAFATGARYANERKQFGKSISSFGAIQGKLADLSVHIFAGESMIYRIAGMIDSELEKVDKNSGTYSIEYQKGIEEYAAECAMAKVFCTDMLARVVDEVLQIHGGYGFSTEYPAERFYRDARISRIYEGTNEVNRILVPGILMRKEQLKEKLLQKGDTSFFNSNSSHSDPEDVLFSREKNLVAGLKNQYSALTYVAYEKFGKELSEQQEIAMFLADLSIETFALESAVLRAEKSFIAATDSRKKNLEAVVRICAFNAYLKIVPVILECASCLAEDCSPNYLWRRLLISEYHPAGTLKDKHHIAQSVIGLEKYLF